MLKFEEAQFSYQEAYNIVSEKDSLISARILRKMGENFMPQRRPDQELIYYDRAVNSLGNLDQSSTKELNQEYIEIQLARVWSYYWMNKISEMKSCLDFIKPLCEKFGSVIHLAIWYQRLILYIVRQQRYRISIDQLSIGEKCLDLSLKSSDYKLQVKSICHIGLLYLSANLFEEAKHYFKESLVASEKIGEIQMAIISLQFLNITYLRTNNIEAVKKYTPIMKVKLKGNMIYYMCMINAFNSWLAWKEKNWEESIRLGLEGMLIQNKAPVPSNISQFCLLGSYIMLNKYEDAIEVSKDLLLPHLFKLPLDIESSIELALNYYDNQETESMIKELKNLLVIAQKNKYL